MSGRLAATLHRCVETTENVALPCLVGWRKSQRALTAMMVPLTLLDLGDTFHAGRDGASFEREEARARRSSASCIITTRKSPVAVKEMSVSRRLQGHEFHKNTDNRPWSGKRSLVSRSG